jgi:hypothetical protein
VVVRGGGHNLQLVAAGHFLPDDVANRFGEIGHRVVFVARVEDLTGDLFCGRFQQEQVRVYHVVDMDIRPHLVAAKYRDPPQVDGMIGQDVDRQIEPLPR